MCPCVETCPVGELWGCLRWHWMFPSEQYPVPRERTERKKMQKCIKNFPQITQTIRNKWTQVASVYWAYGTQNSVLVNKKLNIAPWTTFDITLPTMNYGHKIAFICSKYLKLNVSKQKGPTIYHAALSVNKDLNLPMSHKMTCQFIPIFCTMHTCPTLYFISSILHLNKPGPICHSKNK